MSRVKCSEWWVTRGERRGTTGKGRFLIYLYFPVILLVVLLSGFHIQAQEVTAVDTLSVEIWPDYDQASILVLLTGELSSDTPLPATITVPLPPEAQLNAVARISPDGFMADDIDFTQVSAAVTLTTPDPSFRVEYYYPYEADGQQHSFTFAWTADFAINQMSLSIQQPLSAGTLTTNPAATAITTSQLDGLSYHVLPIEPVPAGQSYTAAVSYHMTSSLLTVTQLQNQTEEQAAVPPPINPTAAPNWAASWGLYLAAAGTALIGIAMFWQVYNNRRKPGRSARPGPATKVRFCHNCGQRSQKGDQFCRQCGTALK